MSWTAEELAAMAAADAEIEADFRLTPEDLALAREVDREAVFDAKDNVAQRLAAKQKAYREANREKVAAQQKAYYEANREKLVDYQRFYRQRKKAEKEARDAMDSGGTG